MMNSVALHTACNKMGSFFVTYNGGPKIRQLT